MASLKNNIRKLLFKNMSQDSIDNFYKIYYKIKYPKEMQKKCSFGNLNSDKIFYVVRPRTDRTEGLMSLFINVVKNIYYVRENGYIPVVDFENYHTQYDDVVGEKRNSWEFFFTQPSNYSLNEIYQSKNVILSGLEIQWYRPTLFEKKYDDKSLKLLHDFLFNQIDFSIEVKKNVKLELERLQMDCSHTIGLYLRGTDYTALKPAGHQIQPTVEQAVRVVDDFIKKYQVDKIFLVTEDGNIYKKIKEVYKDRCIIVSFDSFVESYDGKNFLSHDKSIDELNSSPYKRGLMYLVKLLILSKCAYFIGGDTMGSWATMIFAGNGYRDRYVFDLGVYGK